MFTVPGAFKEGDDLQCGYLRVPEVHGSDTGRTIELAVAIVKSTSSSPAADPIVMLQGGPGGSTIDTYMQVLGLGRLQELRAERDIVLFDQRGTLYSRPALTCPELWKLTEETIERRLSRSESYALVDQATAACRQRLAGEGINLAAFNSRENAADVDDLRVALGYERINLYGVSYGSLLAQHVMRWHPEGLRSVILDAVVPTDINFVPEVPHTEQRAFDELFAACTRDPDCNKHYPDLENVFFGVVDQLNKTPARVPMTDPETHKTYQAVVDGETFESTLFQLLYATEILPALPVMIYRVRDGDYTFLSRVMPLFVFDRTIAQGMYNSVLCAEDADFSSQDVDVSGVRPELADSAVEDADSFLQTCKTWDVPELDLPLDAPVTSDIPTLLLNGRFDPITPPSNGAHAAASLSHAYDLVFGYTGHGALTAGACPEAIAQDFLRDPQREPNSGCIANQQSPAFITPESVTFTPATDRIIDALEGKNLAPLLLAVVCLVPMISLFLIWPIAWLVGKLSQNRQAMPRRPLASLARWAAVLAALVGLLFVGTLTVAVLQAAFSGNDTVLLFGVPRSLGWLIGLPWVMGILTLAMLIGTIAAWMRGYWSIWGRGYYTLLTLAALCSAAGMLLLVA
jgi:pimeloyl-ACP methyl ester carboxylesterase